MSLMSSNFDPHAPPELAENIIVENHDLSLESVYKYYPIYCLPEKLNKPMGVKAKELQYEYIVDNLYEPEANMVAFRVPVHKIAPWIKSMAILYYETYGKMDEYVVEWYDDPLHWNKKQSGKKAICINLATSEIPLMYKITFHINTGVIQAQGVRKDHFTKKDFPRLKSLVSEIVKFNNLTGQAQIELTTPKHVETIATCTSTPAHLNDNNDETLTPAHFSDYDDGTLTPSHLSDDETFLKHQYDTPVNQHPQVEENNNQHKFTTTCTKDCHSQTESTSLTPLVDQGFSGKAFLELMSRMETNFTNALDKICTQQASMLDTKFQTMENIYTKNMKAYDEKFSKVLDRLDKVTENWTTVERENAELKCKISNLNHTTTLEKELLKSELDSKCCILKHQNESLHESIGRLKTNMDKVVTEISEKNSKIDSLENANTSLIMKIEKQEEEILSQKMHNSRDDSAPFQEANRKMRNSNANAIRQDRHDYYTKPHVTLIGTSNIKGINPDKLSSRYSVDKITAFTLCETQSSVRNLTQNPTALVLHSLSNDLKNYTPQQCVDHMKDIVSSVHEEYPETKIVISLPTPRSDSSALNTKAQLVSVMIKECFIDDKFVMWCDNSNMSYKGEALPQFIDRNDGVHLTPNGTAVLAANIRDTVDRILDLPKRPVYKRTPPTNSGRGFNNNRGYFRGRGRGW